MSQIRGGRADKLGNAFERLWVVSLALDVVEGRATAIKWEPLGIEGISIECIVSRPNGTREKHQCKIENGATARWRASDLSEMLNAVKRHLEVDDSARFVFVSRDPVRVLSDLADRARSCDRDVHDFLKSCLSSADHRHEYSVLCGIWMLDSTKHSDAQVAIGLLSRMEFERGFWEPSEKRRLFQIAESIAEGEGSEIVTFLGARLEATLGSTWHSDELRSLLREQGFTPRNLLGDPRIPGSVERLQARFRSALEPYLIRKVLQRSEPGILVERIVAPGGSRLLFVTGSAGSGKSGVLLETLRLLDERKVPQLPIRLDTQYPDKALRAYCSERLDLPASPGVCLSMLAEGRRAVLLIDQLDAVRWTAANSDAGWELCKEIIEDALRFSNITVVVAGRRVDLQDDPRFRHWKERKSTENAVEIDEIDVAGLPETVVAKVVEPYGVSYTSLSVKEKELLSNAQNLQLWWRLAEESRVGTYSSRAALLNSYWSHYRGKAVQEFPSVTSQALNALIDQLVEFMDGHGRLDAPSVLLEEYREAATALRSLGILDHSISCARFVHQSHLDYLTIERVFRRALRSEITPIGWLRDNDQSLLRRDQVRLLLQLLRDQDHGLYLEFLQSIFHSDGIRFHIQHLALTTLANASPPTPQEQAFIQQLWHESAWRSHIRDLVLVRHPHWLAIFTDNGLIPAMLASSDATERDNALEICILSANSAPTWYERVLTPFWKSEDLEWKEMIGSRLIFHDAISNTPIVFQWRLAHARHKPRQHEIYSAEQLAENNQVNGILYLAAIIEGLIADVERAALGEERCRIEIDSDRFDNLLKACEAHSRLSWTTLLHIHSRAVSLEEALEGEKYPAASSWAQPNLRQIISLLHDFLMAAGSTALRIEGTAFLHELSGLGAALCSAHGRKLVLDLIATVPDPLADDAVICMLSVENPLSIDASPEPMALTDTLSAHDPAIGAIRRVSVACSADALFCIERSILGFHSANERRSVEWQRDRIRDGVWEGSPNHYGLPQYALLLALPEHRLSVDGAQALRLWKGKFGDLRAYRSAGPIELRSVVSPIPAGREQYVADNVWVNIVNGKRTEHRRSWRESADNQYIEDSPSSFANSLAEAGKHDPNRYIRLGLRFPKDAQEVYFSALIRVAALVDRPSGATELWTPASIDLVETLIAHIGDKKINELSKSIIRVIHDRSGEKWSEQTLQLLREYALHHPNPNNNAIPGSLVDEGNSRSLEMTVFNSTRCSAILAASQLLWAHPGLLGWAKEIAELVVHDQHPAVRAASFSLALAIGRHDLDIALRLMVRAYDSTDDAVIRVLHGPHLISHLWKQEAELTPVFLRALASSDDKAMELSAYWVTVGNVLEGLYVEMSRQAASGPAAARIGVVRALVDIGHYEEKHRASCLNRLTGFLNDSDEQLQRAIGSIFSRDGFFDAPSAPEFAKRFACSAAFGMDSDLLLFWLLEYEGSLLPFADAIEMSTHQLSGPLVSATHSIGSKHGQAAHYISTLLLRLYQQAEGARDSGIRRRCLDQWDTLLRERVGTGKDVLLPIDV